MTESTTHFSGRLAIVTGTTRGIGRAIALELARRGADVAFNYARSAEAAELLKQEIEALGVRALAMQCDVADTVAAAVAEVIASTGIPVWLTDKPCPTPAISLLVRQRAAAGGILITASNTPYQWNGIKYKAS